MTLTETIASALGVNPIIMAVGLYLAMAFLVIVVFVEMRAYTHKLEGNKEELVPMPKSLVLLAGLLWPLLIMAALFSTKKEKDED